MTALSKFTVAFASLVSLATAASALDWGATAHSVTAAPFQITQEAVFVFHNHGTRPVTVRELRTNCDCLVATTERKTYQPGESGEVRAEFTVGERTGLHEWTITVVTDDSESPVRLTLQVEVPSVATVTPRTVSWPVNAPGAEQVLELTAAPGLEINFTEARSANEAFTVRLEPVVPGKHYRLHLGARATGRPASAAVRVFGREKSGHAVVVSAYARVE